MNVFEPGMLSYAGVALLLAMEVLAFVYRRSILKLLFFSSIAELGLIAASLPLGQVGQLASGMHLIYQVVMRFLVLLAILHLGKSRGGFSAEKIRGSGAEQPFYGVVFAFGMFSWLGLSPYRGAVSRFILMQELTGQNLWFMASLVTLASIIAAVYVIDSIQSVCFDRKTSSAEEPTELNSVAEYLLRPYNLLIIAVSAFTLFVNLSPEHIAYWSHVIFGTSEHLPFEESPWPLTAIVPYGGACILWLMGRYSPKARDFFAVALGVAIVALMIVSPREDIVSWCFGMLSAGVMTAAVVYSVPFFSGKAGGNYYYLFLFWTFGSLMGLSLADNIPSFYLFWELATWSSYFLVVYSRNENALKAGRAYFNICIGSAYVMLLGLLGLGQGGDDLSLAGLSGNIGAIPPLPLFVFGACVLIGLGAKAGIFPLHSWLPLSYSESPSSFTAAFSAVFSKIGLLGVFKILIPIGIGGWSIQYGVLNLGLWMSVLGVVTLLFAEVKALREKDVKTMLAYSSMAQLGEIFAVLGIGTALAIGAAVNHMLAHGLMKLLLFFSVGIVISHTGSRAIRDLRGIASSMPFVSAALVLGLLAIMGLPPFAGFTG